ncbi:MAG TPA: hypothetical protein VEQ60_12045 [Longimicrobium sp.]|nr:hypothetical protein [Longimicrobium sp.]
MTIIIHPCVSFRYLDPDGALAANRGTDAARGGRRGLAAAGGATGA